MLDGVGMFGIAGMVSTAEMAGMVKRHKWDGRYGWDWDGRDGWAGSKMPSTHAVTTNFLTLLFWIPCQVSRSALVHLLGLIDLFVCADLFGTQPRSLVGVSKRETNDVGPILGNLRGKVQ